MEQVNRSSNNETPADNTPPKPGILKKKLALTQSEIIYSSEDQDYHSTYTETEYCTQPTILGESTAKKH